MNDIIGNYNTQRQGLILSEYGRNIQEYVTHLKTIADKDERTKTAYAIIEMMTVLNSDIKLQQNYKEVLWGHLYQISNYDLDIDAPYPLPTKDAVQKKPEHIGYPKTAIKFRFYGRNLQNMVDALIGIEDEGAKQELLNIVASFMFNSSRAWNEEQLSNEAIAEHISRLSQGKLQLKVGDFEITEDKYVPKSTNNVRRNTKSKGNRNKGKKNFRRY